MPRILLPMRDVVYLFRYGDSPSRQLAVVVVDPLDDSPVVIAQGAY